MRWRQLPPSAATLAEARPEWVVINSDTARAMRPGGAKARFYEQLRSGALGHRRVFAERWRAPWTRLVATRSGEWAAALGADPRFRRVDGAVPEALTSRTSVRLVLYAKTGETRG